MLGMTGVDAVLVSAFFWPQLDHGFLLLWGGAVLVHVAVWWRLGRTLPWVLSMAAVQGLLFGWFLLVAVPPLQHQYESALAAITVGLIMAGGLTLMADRRVASLFVGTLTVCALVAFAQSTMNARLMIESVIVAFAVAQYLLSTNLARDFEARVLAEDELDRQKTLVSHLLTDFEESASEGLWETDERGRLTVFSPRLAELTGVHSDQLRGHLLLPPDLENAEVRRGVPFRNLVVPVEAGGVRRWWSLTGKPLKEGGKLFGWRGVGSDVTGSRLKELEVLRLSRLDPLTGLLNRVAFRSLLDELLAPDRPVVPRTLAFIDLVGFKDVNEARGHTYGDALLRGVAERLRESMPPSAVLARLGGDEFALMVPVERSPKASRKDLEALLKSLQQPYALDGERYEALFRIGASFSPQDAATPDQWLRCTDLALRTAKTQDVTRLEVFAPALLEMFRERNKLRQDLGQAIRRGELWLAFQPIVELNARTVSGFEALVRWNHPARGPIAPSVFIPLAEEGDVILKLGMWVLGQACAEAGGWPDNVAVSVNVSGVQLRQASLAASVAAVLAHHRFDPRRLILEVTESALIDDPGVGDTLAALRAHGIRLALDDFGTGYSALAYLQKFPFDKLKIDQAFVRGSSATRRSGALLASIVTLANSLDLATTAEGIEDEAHHDTLRALGCTEGQGYLFSKPVGAAEVPALLARFTPG